ncbi:MAG: hypothetical protein OXH00_03040 [Candidatus Poribacteria bacterium]|nr:hypothetical protein [Candidatus Poribacteria bacterium]
MLDLGHPVTFNEYVGDTDENGQRVDRQFRYYPHAEPPVLVTDGGAGSSEEMMQEESIAYGEDGIAITADTQHELLAFYWQATEKLRTFHDKVARGEIEPANTPDGNPPREEAEDLPPPNMNGNHFTEQRSGMPPVTDVPPSQSQQPEAELPPSGTTIVDIQTLTNMQSRLIVAEFQSVIDLQDMVIQTQSILLSNALEPDSPHHQIMETWMDKLEEKRMNLYGSTGETETTD